MFEHLGSYCATLNYATVLRNITPKDLNTACCTVRLVDRTYGILIFDIRTCDVLAKRLARYGKRRRVKQTALDKLCLYGRNSTRRIKILHVRRSCGRKMTKIRNSFAHLIEKLEIKLNSRLICYGKQMENAVRAATERHITSERIFNRLLIDDITRTNIFTYQLHNCHTRMLCKYNSLIAYRRNGSVTRKSDTNRLTKAVHAVSGVHTRTASATGACARFTLLELTLVYHTCLVRANRLKQL